MSGPLDDRDAGGKVDRKGRVLFRPAGGQVGSLPRPQGATDHRDDDLEGRGRSPKELLLKLRKQLVDVFDSGADKGHDRSHNSTYWWG